MALQSGVAAAGAHLSAWHEADAAVLHLDDVLRVDGGIKARPACASAAAHQNMKLASAHCRVCPCSTETLKGAFRADSV